MLSRFSDKNIHHGNDNCMRTIIHAYLVKGNSIIGPYNNTYTRANITKSSLHAERNAIENIFDIDADPYRKPRIMDKKCSYDILVIRKTRNGMMKSARPCFHCLSLMKAVGIKKCHYSTDDNTIIVERINNMISIHVSYVTLKYMEEKYPKQWNGKKDYFIKMLIKHTPDELPKLNWMMYMNHNLKNILPSLNYSINKNIVSIIDNNNTIHKLVLL
jgi:tRNA(Arg) A34 adenosine deaminase TadA